ncbi:hypothetical protein O181_035137 [Austropuccinia psidii MF-1]|uniref:Uncharacterized protein n=1 Tax=Austropuccinia psidii MF-1 TaxID=1389203 RepID=A0A9Q3D819_9BASI|nr:hypothetical protein [Austropuccinia psidii MF-1]
MNSQNPAYCLAPSLVRNVSSLRRSHSCLSFIGDQNTKGARWHVPWSIRELPYENLERLRRGRAAKIDSD